METLMKWQPIILVVGLLSTIIRAQTTQPNGADLYSEAAKAIAVDCPSSSNLEYQDFPPMPKEWHRMAADAWVKNARARELAHNVRAMNNIKWSSGEDTSSLNSSRALANEVCDAALYQHFNGNDAAALELLLDMQHMTNLQWQDVGEEEGMRGLVAAGIQAMISNRLCVISSDISLTNDPANKTSAQIATVRKLIDSLLGEPKRAITVAGNNFQGRPGPEEAQRVVIETLNRASGEQTFAAMSLACQLFKHEKKRWPEKLDELVPAYLPRVPIDPWGDGKQTFGYVLIKNGLPDEGDRPLIYSRANSKDGMFYRNDRPMFSWYQGDGSKRETKNQKNGGQFRDVTHWVPEPDAMLGPTTHPLPN
jgi:hypothetical protein